MDGVAPLTGAAMWGAGLLLSLANFMSALDTSIANVSVPNIAGSLGVSANEGTWVITSYSVAETITVPLTGWLAGRFGAVRVFVTAMLLFSVFSAACGLAPLAERPGGVSRAAGSGGRTDEYRCRKRCCCGCFRATSPTRQWDFGP